MKKNWLLYIILAIFVIVLLGGLIAYVAYNALDKKGARLDKESKAYVEEVVPKIVAKWDIDKLLNCASPEFMVAIPKDKLEKLFQAFSNKLGPMQQYKGCKGDANFGFTLQGVVITANYVSMVTFEKGEATIKISLINHHGNWQIMGFFVNSETFILN